MTTSYPPSRQRVLVIGGSMAGLLAARVLADHFAQVTIIERDQFPIDPVFRPGVPQAHHLHILLKRGQDLMNHYLPDLHASLVRHQANIYDFVEEVRLNTAGNWSPQYFGDMPFYSCSRPLLEWAVRQEVLRAPNIAVQPLQEAIGLLASPDQRRVTGVQVRARNGQPPAINPPTAIMADLVVDASGRTSPLPKWLQTLGYPAPRETNIDPHLGYATCVMRLPADPHRAWKTLYIMAQPPEWLTSGVVTLLEGGATWQVVLSGCGGQYPPTDHASFLEFARNLRFPDIYEAIKDAEPLGPIYGYRNTSNQLRHYHQLVRFPEGLVVLGDAFAAFNPVYGQGMSVAAMDAAVLDRQLQRQSKASLHGLGRRVQRALAKEVATPWQFSTTADVLVPGVTGAKPTLTTALLNGYLARIYRLMPTMKRAQIAFLNVINMSQPATVLFHPAILTRAIFARKPKRQPNQ